MVAQFRNEESPSHTTFFDRRWESVHPAVRAVYVDLVVCTDHVALDPRVEIARIHRYIVLDLARRNTLPAPDAPVHIDPHTVQVVAGVVLIFARLLGAQCGHAYHSEQNWGCRSTRLQAFAQEFAPVPCLAVEGG